MGPRELLPTCLFPQGGLQSALTQLVPTVLHVCRSYNEWKHEKEQGTSTSQPPEASDSAAAGSGGGSGGSSTSVGAAVQDAGQEAKHTAQSAKEVVKMEGEAAGEGERACALQSMQWPQ